MTKQSRLLCMLLLGLVLSPPLLARGGISLDQAVEQARERTGGRVISAETREKNGHRIHSIRILTNDGKVRRLRIDAGDDRRSNRR
ncbi:MAG: ribosome biogenesis GTPase RsgA [Candidatus Thiodiazotropha sp.]|jgi:uncharacterized membrane protein YkoI